MLVNVLFKIPQARLQQYANCKLPDVQAGLRKGRRTRDQIANIHWIIEKERELHKKHISVSLTMLKPLTVWLITNCGKFLKRCEYQTILHASWETWTQAKKQQLEPDMEQGNGLKLGKEYVKAVYCHSAYLSYMKNSSWEMLGWMKYKLESRLWEEISITWYADGTILMAENEKKLRSLLKVKEESKRAGLKFNIQKSKIMAPSPIALHGKSMGNNRNCERLYFLGLQNHCRWWLQPWN